MGNNWRAVGPLLLGTALLLACGCGPHTITPEGEELQEAFSKGNAMCAFSSDSKSLVVGADRPNCKVFRLDLATRKRVTLYRDLAPGCSALAFSPDGKWLALGHHSNGSVRLWDVAAAREVACLAGDDTKSYSVSFSPDSSLLASAEHGGRVRVWDTKTKKQQFHLSEREAVKSVAFTPDGSALVYMVCPETVYVCDLARGTTRVVVQRIPDGIDSVTLLPGGKSLLLVRESVGVHDLRTGKRILSFSPKSAGARRGTGTPDGKYLVIGCGDFLLPEDPAGYVEVWTTSGEYVTRFRAHDRPVTCVVVSPDGRWLATGDYRGSAKLWKLASILPKEGK
jgi:WD40 repeat protein